MMNLSGCAYMGGKARAQIRNWLNSLIPHNPRGLYCEPFAGMLGVLLGRPAARQEVVNDLDSNIVAFWRVVRDADKYQKLERAMLYTQHARAEYDLAVEKIRNKSYEDDVDHAWAVATMLMQGVTHSLGQKGWAATFTATQSMGGESFAEKVDWLHRRIKDVQIECIDAGDFIDSIAKRNAVIYCDPPYRTSTTSFYQQELDVDRLTDAVRRCNGKVAISGYNDEWDHLGWNKVTKQLEFAGIGASPDKAGVRTETLWMNYDVPHQQTALF